MTETKSVRINVPVLTRVEGEGALDLQIRDERIETLHLRIYEPPRLFEKFLEGRSYTEVPDMVARICGICPVAYQMSTVHALEQAFAVQVPAHIHAWRRLFYCGEWLQSHSLHIHMLAAPDFLGFDNVTAMARKHPDEVRRGLRLQALGNDIMRLLGGRSVHPVGARVGGFHQLPAPAQCASLLQRLRDARGDARDLVGWTASLPLPDDHQDFCSVALHHPDEYPLNRGRIVSDNGLDIAVEDFEQRFDEFQVPWSTALHASLDGKPYLVGPLARVNLHLARMGRETIDALEQAGIRFPSYNMFHSIVARAAEILYALEESIRILESSPETEPAWVDITPAAASGYACTEAPRGILWHRYDTHADGTIATARIVPPTAQNQGRIEQDLHNSLQAFGLDRDQVELRLRAETVIRNYDPCISCATHFLTLNVEHLTG